IFSTWEWATAWWSSYGNSGELRILAAFDERDVLRGIAPLRAGVVRKYGQTVPSLSFVGDGSNDSDYLDFIIDEGFEKEVMESFRSHWAREIARGAMLTLNEIPETSPSLPVLR